MFKDTKASIAAGHAARAVKEGRTTMLYRYDVAATSTGFSGPLSGAAEVVEAIEGQGWQVGEMAYDGQQSKNGCVILLFRRAS
jgi:hypothetical protein